MRFSRLSLVASAAFLIMASAALAQGNDCKPRFRVGNIQQVSKSDCTWVWGINPTCDAAGKCPEQQGQQCTKTGSLAYAWTVTKTGGSGSISVGALTGSTVTVTVTPPVTYEMSVTVSGCAACCAVPAGCVGPTTTAPAATSRVRTERIRKGVCR